MICPSCQAQIAPDDINVPADTALCRACGRGARFSELVHKPHAPATPGTPLSGAWDIDDGVERRIGATTRSWVALFVVPFMCVWAGASLGGIYGSQIWTGKFNLGMSLFGIPFLLGSILLGSFAAMMVCGKVEVRLRGATGRVFVGLGSIGWSRPFDLSEFSRIREDFSGVAQNGQMRRAIVLEGARRLSFGTMLSDPRRYFIIESLRPLIHA